MLNMQMYEETYYILSEVIVKYTDEYLKIQRSTKLVEQKKSLDVTFF